MRLCQEFIQFNLFLVPKLETLKELGAIQA